jgi:SAM-dependent methyltransferase
LAATLEEVAAGLSGNEAGFLARVWATDPEVYRERLRSLGLAGRRHVLDAGSGLGQWARCLGELNNSVSAVELSPARVEVSRRVLAAAGQDNVAVSEGSIERLPFADAQFDAIFCYSVVYVTDYARSLAELARVLAPGGLLYVSSNGLGWHLARLVSGQGSGYAAPRRDALGTLARTARYRLTGAHAPGRELVTSRRRLQRVLARHGLTRSFAAADGRAGDVRTYAPVSFYPARRYGLDYVFEILATKDGPAA